MSGAGPSPGIVPTGAAGFHPASRRKRILIAERDGFTRLMLIVRFRVAGVAVDFTSDGDLALGRLRRCPPDALLVELKLSGLSGLKLIRSARLDPAFGDRPIYVFTHAGEMKRAVKKELQKTVTAVFDKSLVDVMDVVRSIAPTLAERAVDQKPEAMLTKTPALPPVDTTDPADELNTVADRMLLQWEVLTKCQNLRERVKSASGLLSEVRELYRCAHGNGASALANQAKAVEGFLSLLCQQPQAFAGPAMNLITRGVEALGALVCDQAGNEPGPAQLTAVIIDESTQSNQALSDALLAVGVRTASFSNPAHGLRHLVSHSADLIIANLQTPELHGLDLPTIRQMPLHTETPVVFVPEPSTSEHDEKALSIRAPQLNLNPLLLTEIVMQGLNDMENRKVPSKREMPRPQAWAPPAEQVPTASDTDVTWTWLPAAGPDGAAEARETEMAIQDTATVTAATGPTPDGSEAPVAPRGVESAMGSEVAAHEVGSDGRTVLFVEDDPFTLTVYAKALAQSGFRVEVAADGATAVEVLPQLQPNLVVLDLLLPELDGLEVLKFIRSDSQLKDTPVLVLSNAYLDQLGTKALRAGANAGLAKSECSPGTLIRGVCELLGQAQTQPAGQAMTSGADAGLSAGDAELAAETVEWIQQAGLRKQTPEEISQIRQVCLDCIKAVNREQGVLLLGELYRRIRFLTAQAALTGLTKISKVSTVLEGLLFEVVFDHRPPGGPTLQTIAQAVDVLDQLIRSNDTTFTEPRVRPKVLVVDGESDSNITLVAALERGNFDAVGVRDPVEGFRMLKATSYDLVLLDIHMPFLNGFEICQQLRRMPQYKAVPVIFLTSQVELNDRARSVISGGNDLIAKSASPLEQILKVTTHLLMPREEIVSARANAQVSARADYAEDALNARWVVEDAGSQTETAGARGRAASQLTSAPAANDGLVAAAPSEEGPQPAEAATGRRNDRGSIEVEDPQAYALDTGDSAIDESVFAVGVPEGESARTLACQAAEPALQVQRGSEAEVDGDQSALTAGSVAAAPEISEDAERSPEVVVGAETFTGEAAKPLRTLAEREQERERLVNRIVAAENDLHRAQARLKRGDAAIESLQKQLEEFTALRMQQAPAKVEPTGEGVVSFAENSGGKRDAGKGPSTPGGTVPEQEQARLAKLEKELAGLCQVRGELETKLLGELQVSAESSARVKGLEDELKQQALELEQARARCEAQAQERASVESGMRGQLEAAATAAQQRETVHEQTKARCALLEEELARLHQAGERLNSQVAQEQQAGVESARRVQELERDLARQRAGMEQTRAELEAQARERGGRESDLQAELEAAGVAHNQARSRADQLQQELTVLRRAHEELADQLVKAQQGGADSSARVKELEKRLQSTGADLTEQTTELDRRVAQGVAALARATSDLAKERGARERSDKRAAALNLQLQELHEEVKRLLECHRGDQERLGEFEAQLRQQDEAVAQREADLEDEQAERRLAEERLEEAKELNAHFRKNLSFFETANQSFDRTRQELQARLDAALDSARESHAGLQRETAERQGLASALDGVQRELEDQRRRREALEAELQASQRTLQERESRLYQEAAERQRLNQALESAQLTQRDQCQRTELELSRLRSELEREQVERKRLETQHVRMRQATLASARGARLLRSGLRKQIREPVQQLYRSSRELLQLEMGEEQRRLAETILQEVLLVHNCLQEPEAPQDPVATSGQSAENAKNSADGGE